MSILETINLGKIYGKKDVKVNALKDINLNIEKGEFVAIVGPSGSGKSTMLYLYRRKDVGFIFQQFNLIPILNVRENIELPLMIGNDDIDENYIEELIDILGLKDREKHLPSQLSGGQQQRVAIGRSLSTKPSIILADEPTGNLDSKTTEEVMNLLKVSSNKFNQTLIIITHDNNIAQKADRIISIVDGELK